MPCRRYERHLGVVCLYVVSNITINQEIDVGYITSKCHGDGYERHLGIVCLYVVANITIYREIDVDYNTSKWNGGGTGYI